MLKSTPRIEVNQRSREARLRLERVERLIIVVMNRRSLLVPRTSGLAAKLRRVLRPIQSRPNRPNRFRSVTTNGRVCNPHAVPAVRSRLGGFPKLLEPKCQPIRIMMILTSPWRLDHLPDDPL
jgi:hypothetical protein